MIKKIGYFLFANLMLLGEAFAFLPPPPTPFSFEFDPSNDVVEAGKAVGKELKTAQDQFQQIETEAVNKVTSAQNFTSLDMRESPMKKADDEPMIASSKTIKESKVVNINDPQSVADGFVDMFLMYPEALVDDFPLSARAAVLKSYDNKQAEFVTDAIMEASIALEDLKNNRLPALESDLADMSACFVEGKSGNSSMCDSASDSDEELGNAANKYKLQAVSNATLRLYQEMMAISIMYEAGMALQEGLEPFNKDEVLSTNPGDKNTFVFEKESKASFAQMVRQSSLLQGSGDVEDKAEKMPAKQVKKASSPLTLEKPVEFKEQVPFAGAEENLNALPVLEGAYDLLSDAQFLHNTKQQMEVLRKPFIEYEKMKALHEATKNNLADSEQKVRNYLGTYYSDPDSLWFGNGCRFEKQYLGQKCPHVTGCKKVSEYQKYYVNMIRCANNVFEINDYVHKNGLSKETIEMYRESKAEDLLSALGIDANNPAGANLGTATVDLDMDTTLPDMNESMAIDENVSTNEENNEEATAIVRAQDLNRWQIGSEVAQKIGEDMLQDGKIFGLNIKKKYPLWLDEKRFYDQYLREKYKNIELYFESYRLSAVISKLMKLFNDNVYYEPDAVSTYTTKRLKTAESRKSSNCYKTVVYDDGTTGRSKDNKCIQDEDNSAKNDIAKFERELNTGFEQLKANNQTQIDIQSAYEERKIPELIDQTEVIVLENAQSKERIEFETTYQNKLAKLAEQEQAYYDKLYGMNFELENKKKDYNEFMSTAKDEESSASAQDEVIKLADEKKAKDPSYESNIKSDAEKTKATSLANAVIARQKAQELQPIINELQIEVDEYKNLIKNVGTQREKLKAEHITEAVALEHKQMQEMLSELASRSNYVSENKMIDASILEGNSESKTAISTFKDIIVQNLLPNYRNRAAAYVKQAYKDINSLKDAKYDYNQYDKILRIHTDMIDKIKRIDVTSDLRNVSSLSVMGNTVNVYLNVVSLAGKINDIFNQVAFANDCDGFGCKQEDSEYYLTLEGNRRDLTAPKRMFANRQAPVREIFHFDAVDYDEILKTPPQISYISGRSNKTQRTTRQEFMNVSRQMPLIWKLILTPHSFGERDVDLTDILPVHRIMVYSPEGSYWITDPYDGPSEAFLEAKGEKPVEEEDMGELSRLLKYDNGLAFTFPVYNLAQFFIEEDDDEDQDTHKEKTKMFLARNQIGDYLQFMDQEQLYQVKLNNLKVKIDEGRRTLEEALKKAFCEPKRKETGYVKDAEIKIKFVSSEFIADEEVFESVKNCLDQGKNMYLEQAQELMASLPDFSDYEYLQDRKNKLDNMIKTMQMDNEEFVQLSDNTLADGALQEQIKSKKTDGEVVGRYGGEADKEFKNNLNNFETPFQAKYF